MEFRRVVGLSGCLVSLTGAVACFMFVQGVISVPSNDEWLKGLRDSVRFAQWLFVVLLVVITLNELYLWRTRNRAPRQVRWSDEKYALSYVAVVGLAFFCVTAAVALGAGVTLSSLVYKSDRHDIDVAKLGRALRDLQRAAAK